MSSKADDLEAVRILADTLQPFAAEDRERIIRWAREKVGMTATVTQSVPQRTDVPPPDAAKDSATGQTVVDIKKFVIEKAPRSDVHFAAAVAYFHQFKAPENQRKDSITKEDLVEACRQVDRKRSKVPAQVLVNAYQDGLFDRGGKGHYKLNSVGENLVAMALPGTIEPAKRATKKKATKGRRKGSGKKEGARKGR
jgi:hypothetical protein